jgi:hypothetical protein
MEIHTVEKSCDQWARERLSLVFTNVAMWHQPPILISQRSLLCTHKHQKTHNKVDLVWCGKRRQPWTVLLTRITAACSPASNSCWDSRRVQGKPWPDIANHRSPTPTIQWGPITHSALAMTMARTNQSRGDGTSRHSMHRPLETSVIRPRHRILITLIPPLRLLLNSFLRKQIPLEQKNFRYYNIETGLKGSPTTRIHPLVFIIGSSGRLLLTKGLSLKIQNKV